MLKRYETWVYGLKMLAFVLLIAFGMPLAICAFLAMIAGLLFFIFGLNSAFLEGHAKDILWFAVVVFGPYYLGAYWETIEETSVNLRPKADKTD